MASKDYTWPYITPGMFGAVGQGADETAAFVEADSAAAALGYSLVIPYTPMGYVLSSLVTYKANWVGIGGKPVITLEGNRNGSFLTPATDGLTLTDIVIDHKGSQKTGNADVIDFTGRASCKAVNVEVRNPKRYAFNLENATLCEIIKPVANIGSSAEKFHLSNTVACRIEDAVVNNGVPGGIGGGFCFYVSNGSHHNHIVRSRTTSSQLESIGVTFDCYENQIEHPYAEGTGDNGISVTGYRNTITSPICIGNRNHGVGLYGSYNTVIAPQCHDNGQVNLVLTPAAYAGVAVVPAFGGLGRGNVIVGAVCNDDQAVPTQWHGVKVDVAAYVAWISGATILNSNLYRSNGSNVYKATGPGTTGATAPVHTSGTVSDGGVSWTWVASTTSQLARPTVPWVTATAVTTANLYRTNANKLYVATAAGITGVTPPTHTSGSVSDGSVTWTFVEEFPANFDAFDNKVIGIEAGGNVVSPFILSSGQKNFLSSESQIRMGVQGRNLFSDIFILAGSPVGNVAAQPGSLALRRDTNANLLGLAVKDSQSGTAGWQQVSLNINGTTANRPILGATQRAMYFDDTLGKAIWWTGTDWKDASGTVV